MPQVTDLAEVKAFGVTVVHGFKLLFQSRIMAGTIVLLKSAPPVQYLDLNGAIRNFDLPAAASSKDLVFYVRNISAGAFALTVRDAAAATVVSLAQNTFAMVHCDGTTWRVIG